MKAIELCAGAGGLSLGLQDAGFDVLGVELDDVAASFHREHVGPCETADMTTWHPPYSVELVAGGVPCQSFSIAGRRLGLADPRGQLFRHLIRIGVEANARALLIENALGLVSSPGALDTILQAFEAAGYRSTWTVLNAQDFGVPQNRKRVFIVGLRADARIQWPEPTHGPWLSASAPYVSVRQAFGLDSSGGMQLLGELKGAGLADRPSTTVQAHGAGRLAIAGHHDRQWNGSVRVSIEQCAILQDFPRGLPWPAKKSDAHRLIGNACPRRLSAAVGRSLRDVLAKRKAVAA